MFLSFSSNYTKSNLLIDINIFGDFQSTNDNIATIAKIPLMSKEIPPTTDPNNPSLFFSLDEYAINPIGIARRPTIATLPIKINPYRPYVLNPIDLKMVDPSVTPQSPIIERIREIIPNLACFPILSHQQ